MRLKKKEFLIEGGLTEHEPGDNQATSIHGVPAPEFDDAGMEPPDVTQLDIPESHKDTDEHVSPQEPSEATSPEDESSS